MGCQFTEPRKPPVTDISLNSPEFKELLDAYPQHRPLTLALFEAIRANSPEATYERWLRLVRDELARMPPRNINTPFVEAPGDLGTLMEKVKSGHLCVAGLRKGEMLYMLGIAFRDLGLTNAFQISPEDFMEFSKTLVIHMKTFYHSFEFSFHSCMSLLSIIQSSSLLQQTLTPDDKLSLLLAAIGAVYDHPCRTNEFLVKSQNTLAATYLYEAVIEQHCATEFVSHLQRFALLAHLSTTVSSAVLRHTKEMIAGLEPGRFRKKLAKFVGGVTPGDSKRTRVLKHVILHCACGWAFLTCIECKTELQKQLVQEFARENREAKVRRLLIDTEEEARFSLEYLGNSQREAWTQLSSTVLDESPLKERVDAILQSEVSQ